jgi:hypothetical protein
MSVEFNRFRMDYHEQEEAIGRGIRKAFLEMASK